MTAMDCIGFRANTPLPFASFCQRTFTALFMSDGCPPPSAFFAGSILIHLLTSVSLHLASSYDSIHLRNTMNIRENRYNVLMCLAQW